MARNCVQPKGNREFVFSVDPTVEDPGDFGYPVAYTEALNKASLGNPAVDDEPYSDAWGRFCSSYSPVFASDGSIAGIVAVDFSAEWYDEQIARQTRTITACLVTSTILCVLLLLIATSHMRQRLKDMTKSLADLAHDVDDLTWGMADIGSPGELQRTLSEDDVHLDNLYERARTVKDGLRRFSENTSSKANSIITALASDYQLVYYLNPDTNQGCYRALETGSSLK